MKDDIGKNDIGSNALNPHEAAVSANVNHPSGSEGNSKRRNKRFRRRERQIIAKTLGALDISGDNPSDGPAVGVSPQQRMVSGKRPRSEGSSPLVAVKKPKEAAVSMAGPSNTRPSFGQVAASDSIVRVLCKDTGLELTKGDLDYLVNAVDLAILKTDGSVFPRIRSNILRHGCVRFACADKETLDWLKPVLKGIGPRVEGHPGYCVIGPGDQPL